MTQPLSPALSALPSTGLRTALMVDTETTGISAHDDVIEYGHVLFRFDPATGVIHEILDEYTALREPKVAIQPGAQRVNGITWAMVRGQQLDLARVAAGFAQADVVYAHNASFDLRFMARLLPMTAERPWVCTMRQVDWLGQGVRSRKLDHILAFYGLAEQARHRALDDVHGTLQAVQQRDRLSGLPHLVTLARAPRQSVAEATTGRPGRPPAAAAGFARRPAFQRYEPDAASLPTHAAALPLSQPVPRIEIATRRFCFTGVFRAGGREWCEAQVVQRGGLVAAVSRKLDYLVIGDAPHPDWLHGNFGTKIERGVQLRGAGAGLHIVSAGDWLAALQQHDQLR